MQSIPVDRLGWEDEDENIDSPWKSSAPVPRELLALMPSVRSEYRVRMVRYRQNKMTVVQIDVRAKTKAWHYSSLLRMVYPGCGIWMFSQWNEADPELAKKAAESLEASVRDYEARVRPYLGWWRLPTVSGRVFYFDPRDKAYCFVPVPDDTPRLWADYVSLSSFWVRMIDGRYARRVVSNDPDHKPWRSDF